MKRNIQNILMSGLFAVAIFLFFFLVYPFHICHQEQCQLFEFTLRYLAATLAVPGGLADWIARFLTQFFISAICGSLIMAFLLTGIQIVTVHLCRSKALIVYAMSFAAPILLVLFFCNGDAMVSAPVAILLSLLSAKAVFSVKRTSVRRITALLSVIPLFFLLGSASIVFSVAILLRERKLWFAITMITIFLICSVSIHFLLGYPLFRVFYGINYFRFHENYSFFNWYAIAALAVAMTIGNIQQKKEKPMEGLILYLILILSGVTGIIFCRDRVKEEYMKYDTLSSRFQWDSILHEARKDRPSMPYSVAAVNLAIVKTGNLSRMFEYNQVGAEGLLPEFQKDYLLAWTPSEAYFQLGMINTCQRHTYEAQELIPDSQKSARAYQRLAETNLVNGHYNVARKYLRALTHTCFYRHWAKSMLAMIDKDDESELGEGYEYLQSVRLKEKDFLFNHNAMEAMLVHLINENPANHMALDYLLMWDILSRNLNGFMQACPFTAYKVVPRPFQEAFVLAAFQNGEVPAEIPSFISKQVVNAFAEFIESQRMAGKDLVARKFGNTYWYYYFYSTAKQ